MDLHFLGHSLWLATFSNDLHCTSLPDISIIGNVLFLSLLPVGYPLLTSIYYWNSNCAVTLFIEHKNFLSYSSHNGLWVVKDTTTIFLLDCLFVANMPYPFSFWFHPLCYISIVKAVPAVELQWPVHVVSSSCKDHIYWTSLSFRRNKRGVF
jgi:hypothetical protein